MKLNNRLRELREGAHLVQADLANFLKVKLPTYQAYEQDRAEPSLEQVAALASFYGITVDELINGETRERSKVEAAYQRLPLERRKIVDFILQL